MNLFAYGTLMHPEIMRAVALELPPREPARLRGYERKALRGRPYPGIRERPGCSVAGVLYREVSAPAWERLDRFEGDMYVRRVVEAISASGIPVPACTYVIKPAYAEALDDLDWDYEGFLREARAGFEGEYRGFAEIDPKR